MTMKHSKELNLNFEIKEGRLIFEDGVIYSGNEVMTLRYMKARLPEIKYKEAINKLHLLKSKVKGLSIIDFIDDKELA